MVIDEAFLFHFGKLTGQRAAIGAQVFRPFHSAQRDLKAVYPLTLGLDGQLGQDPFPQGLL